MLFTATEVFLRTACIWAHIMQLLRLLSKTFMFISSKDTSWCLVASQKSLSSWPCFSFLCPNSVGEVSELRIFKGAVNKIQLRYISGKTYFAMETTRNILTNEWEDKRHRLFSNHINLLYCD